jgi:serine/threonine protein kinase
MHCDALITFEGAFYNEGTINVVLENMTAGSLEDLVNLSGAGIPEHILASMTEQIVDGMAFMHGRKQVGCACLVFSTQTRCLNLWKGPSWCFVVVAQD